MKTDRDGDGTVDYTSKYDYDRLGQLVEVNNTAYQSRDMEISYDPNGNITSMRRGSATRQYSYYAGTNQVKNTDGSGADITYNARGSATRMGNRDISTIEHDRLTGKTRRMVGAGGTVVRYQYGPSGSRVYRKNEKSGAERLYLRGGGSRSLVEIAKASGAVKKTVSVYGATGRIARKTETASGESASGDNGWSYLIKDHLGSTRVVVDEGGGTSRLEYDAFGVLRRDESGGEVRYTYTGQETETAIASGGKGGLMNYGARMYDPYLGRFLSVDPAGQFHSPYTYAGNNPVRMVDPNGEIALSAAIGVGMMVSALTFSGTAMYAGMTGRSTDRFESTTSFMLAAGKGGVSGALGLTSYSTIGQAVLGASVSKASSFLPSKKLGEVGGVTFRARPQFAFGTHGLSGGAMITASGEVGGFDLSASYSGTFTQGTLASKGGGWEQQLSYGGSYSWGDQRLSYYRTTYWANKSQTIGTLGYRNGDVSVRTSNDVSWVGGDGGDRWRTAALQIGYKDFRAGFNLYTGTPGPQRKRKSRNGNYVGYEANDPSLRMGAAYIGLRNNGKVYRAGGEGEPIRAGIQNGFHGALRWVDRQFGDDPVKRPANFRQLDNDIDPYGRVGTPRRFTLY